MYYLSDQIKAITGVTNVVPATRILIPMVVTTTSLRKNKSRRFMKALPNACLKNGTSMMSPAMLDHETASSIDPPPPPMIARPRTNGYSSREQSYMTTSSRSFISYSTAASYNGLWQSSGFRQNLGKLSKSDSWNSTPAKSKCLTFPGDHIWILCCSCCRRPRLHIHRLRTSQRSSVCWTQQPYLAIWDDDCHLVSESTDLDRISAIVP